MTRVKLCGMRTTDDVDDAVAAGADAVGVICDVPVETPREVPRATAETLIAHVPPFVTSVLVTMGHDRVPELTETLGPDVVQVHGEMTSSGIEALRETVAVVRAVGVRDDAAIEAADGAVDGILIDSVDATGAGGTGETHDWTRTREHVERLDTPVVLAGGLTPENVGRAVDQVRPYGVDVASGVEGTDGKDPRAMERFVDAANTATGGS